MEPFNSDEEKNQEGLEDIEDFVAGYIDYENFKTYALEHLETRKEIAKNPEFTKGFLLAVAIVHRYLIDPHKDLNTI